MMYGTIKLMHTGENRNHSNLTEEAANKCLSSIPYKPVLASFTTDANGEEDFTSHDFEFDKDGNVIYHEKQIGCLMADGVHMDTEPDENGRKYIYARVAIPKEYTPAADIISRKNGTKVSVELVIKSMDYDAKSKVLNLNDVEVQGVTCLGVNPQTGQPINEGMEGASLTIDDFNVNNYAAKYASLPMKEIIQNQSSDNQNRSAIGGEKSGGKEDRAFMDDDNKIVDDNDEVDSAETPTVSDGSEEDNHDEQSTAAVEESDANKGTDGDDESEVTEPESFNCSYSIGNMKFEMSMSDIQYALETLVNETYSEDSDDWYYSEVYPETNTVIFYSCKKRKHYRQNYTCENDVYSLIGDAVQVFPTFVTKEEQDALDEMKQNYRVLQDKVSAFEKKEESVAKKEILSRDKYSAYLDTDMFKDLRDKMDTYSVQDFDTHCELAFAKCVEKMGFSTNNSNSASHAKFVDRNRDRKRKTEGRYGSLFSSNN